MLKILFTFDWTLFCVTTLAVLSTIATATSNDLGKAMLRCYTPCKVKEQKPADEEIIWEGTEATTGEFPFLVSIRRSNYDEHEKKWVWGHSCAGVLIDDHWILTAAHCDFKVRHFRNQLTLTAVAGSTFKDQVTYCEQRRTIKKEIFHEMFEEKDLSNDIALYELELPFTVDNFVNIASLPDRDYKVQPGTNCTVMGWGPIDLTAQSPCLMKFEVEVVDIVECIESYGAPQHAQEGDICVVRAPETGIETVCSEDYGSALLCKGKLAGIMSRYNSEHVCGTDFYPIIYIPVAFYTDWIDSHIDVDEEEDDNMRPRRTRVKY